MNTLDKCSYLMYDVMWYVLNIYIHFKKPNGFYSNVSIVLTISMNILNIKIIKRNSTLLSNKCHIVSEIVK